MECVAKEGCTGKEKIVTDVPQNPESMGSAQPAGGAVPPFQPVAPAYQPVNAPGQTFPTLTPPPVQQGGNKAVKIILIVVGVFVVLILLVVGAVGYIGYRMAHSLHQAANGAMTVDTPGGVVSMNDSVKFTAADLGVDIYPGATQDRGSMRMTLPSGPVVAANYLTSDSVSQVVAFYKDKLGSGATSMQFGSTAMLTKTDGGHDSVTITITQKSGHDDGKTQIHIQHTAKN
jgi:hypothetical protein